LLFIDIKSLKCEKLTKNRKNGKKLSKNDQKSDPKNRPKISPYFPVSPGIPVPRRGGEIPVPRFKNLIPVFPVPRRRRGGGNRTLVRSKIMIKYPEIRIAKYYKRALAENKNADVLAAS